MDTITYKRLLYILNAAVKLRTTSTFRDSAVALTNVISYAVIRFSRRLLALYQRLGINPL